MFVYAERKSTKIGFKGFVMCKNEQAINAMKFLVHSVSLPSAVSYSVNKYNIYSKLSLINQKKKNKTTGVGKMIHFCALKQNLCRIKQY